MPEPRLRRLPRLAGALGMARVLAGTLWLDAYIGMNRGREPQLLLASTWSVAGRLGLLFAGSELFRNKFGRGWRDILFLRILKRLNRNGARCLPQLSVKGFETVRAAADSGRPVIAVMAHSPLDAIINRQFDEAKIPWAVLAARPRGVILKARLLGLSGDIEVIAQDNDALLAMRQRLAAGRSICSCIDFTQETGRSLRGHVFVSPALFQLAKLTRSQVVYADASVLRDGVIELVFAKPRLDAAANAAEACAEDFIDWLRTERGDRRRLEVRKWINPASAGAGPR